MPSPLKARRKRAPLSPARTLLLFCAMAACGANALGQTTPPTVDADGTVHVPAFALPESSYLTPATRAELAHQRIASDDPFSTSIARCPSLTQAAAHESSPAQLANIRACQARAFYETPFYHDLRKRYPARISSSRLGGVPVEIIEPVPTPAADHAHRVLIDLHGGSFMYGARTISQVESIPIAASGRITVISIDYRLAPEARFPAATDDVEAVYRELLQRYAPGEIGFYGCSAGAALIGQSIARFLERHLPLPAAIGLCGYGVGRALDSTHERWIESDSAYFVGALSGTYPELREPLLYFSGATVTLPEITPGDHDEIIAHFPPTLLISGTRDYLLSSVVSTHAQLVRLHVEADLHVWEGMQHAFLYYPALSESREAYAVIAHFFNTHLAG